MKRVLLIDASPMFREFLKEKLTAEKVDVDTATVERDAFTKMVTSLPDLVILDLDSPQSINVIVHFLEDKLKDPNAKTIPMIVSGPVLPQDKLTLLSQYGVIKYFTKPIKFDIFFESIGKILKQTFSIDVTPCVLEVHLKGNIIFIDIAQGLNREKLALLKYKLPELIDAHQLEMPKVIILLTDLQLSFVDGINLELLVDNILDDARIQKKNVKILSLDEICQQFIDGHKEYDGIEVASDITKILGDVVNTHTGESDQDLISDKLLSADADTTEGSIEMRFMSDSGVMPASETGGQINVAIVDDDAVIRKLLSAAFETVNAKSIPFDSSIEFMNAVSKQHFDLVILDIYMPGLNGFDVLKNLQEKSYKTPIVVYSQVTQRDAVMQTLTLGAKSFMIKPQKPEVVVQKSMEILHKTQRK